MHTLARYGVDSLIAAVREPNALAIPPMDTLIVTDEVIIVDHSTGISRQFTDVNAGHHLAILNNKPVNHPRHTLPVHIESNAPEPAK
jgi:hypothetical protein